MKPRTRIVNGTVILPNQLIEKGTVLIEDGKILAVEKGFLECSDAITIDAENNFISPGFVDIHVHGGGGYDFMDGTAAAFLNIAAVHARYGTTSMMPTTLTAENQDLLNSLDAYELVKDQQSNGASFIGMHLEGPYFSMAMRGAQDPKFIRDPDPEEYLALLAHNPSIKRWSIAPEKKGAIELGRLLVSKGILPSMAHTDAVYEEALEAFENGYSLLTHFYSAMSTVTRKNAFRKAGVVEAGYLHDDLDVEIIADGIHLPPPLLKLIYKIKGPDHTALITDAMRAADLPEGKSYLGNSKNRFDVIVEDGVAKLPDRSSFAGSVALANQLVRNMIKLADVPLIDAVKMMTSTPARIMKMEHLIGRIQKGMQADLVIFDESINVLKTIVKGKMVFEKSCP